MKKLFVELCYFWLNLWLKIKSWSIKTKWLVWDRSINKFCGPLNWNSNAMLSMSHEQRITYTVGFYKRRRIAHERDLASM